jgi:hypothetical protein
LYKHPSLSVAGRPLIVELLVHFQTGLSSYSSVFLLSDQNNKSVYRHRKLLAFSF